MLTFVSIALHQRVEIVRGGKEEIDMCDELFRCNSAVDICAVAHMDQHVRNAGRRLFLVRRECSPDPEHFLLDLLLVVPYALSLLLTRGAIDRQAGWRRCISGLCKADVPVLVDHVALRMPVLVDAIAIYLDELLEDRCLTTVAFLSKSCRVVIVAIHVAFVLVVAVGRPENGGAY